MFYLVGIFRTSILGDSISSDPERRIKLYRSLQQRANSLNIKSIKETQTSQVKKLVLFCIWEDTRAKLTEIIPFIYILAIWSQSLLFSSMLTLGSGYNRMAAERHVLVSFLVALEGWYCCDILVY